MSKNLFITLPWDKSYTLLVSPISGRFAADQNHVGFEMTPATTDSLGGIIVGDNLVVTDSGRLSATGSGVAGVSSFNNRVGKIDLMEKDVSDALGFRPVNYKLPVATETTLGGVKQGKNVTIASDGAISVDDIPTPYHLPVAATDTLGGIKVGKNLTITEDGTLNAEGGAVAGVTAFNGRKGDVKLTKKDVTDVVSIPDPYDLPVASEKTLGGIKVGYNLEVKDDGTLNALDQKVEIHPATTQTLGGIIVGDNLEIDSKGRLSAIGGGDVGVTAFNGRTGRVVLKAEDVSAVQQVASKASLGVVKVGRNLTIQPDGTLDADDQGAAAGVSSFNGRKGDVVLETKDLPIADNDGHAGIILFDSSSETTIGRRDDDGCAVVVMENLIVPDGGLAIDEKYKAFVKCDNTTIKVNSNGELEAHGGGGGGVTSFNKRKGDVLLNSQDILEAAPIATKSHLGLVKAGKNVTIEADGSLDAVAEFVPATATTLGGIKVGSGLSVTSDGTLSAAGGGSDGLDEYTYKLWDFGMATVRCTYDTNIIPNVKQINVKKPFPAKAIYITVPKLMDSFYHEKDVLVWQMCTGSIKMQSNYDNSIIDVGTDCIAYVRTYTNGFTKTAIRVENEWVGLDVDVTKILADMSLVQNGNVVIKIEPTKEATDTGTTYTFGSKSEDEGSTVWKKTNLLGCQTLTVHKNQLFVYDYRLYKSYGNQLVFNFDVPSNSFTRKSWSKTIIFRDNSIDLSQVDHTILFNVNARNKDVCSPFMTEVTGGMLQVKIPYTANKGDRIIHVSGYDNVIMVTGDTQTRIASVVKDAYGAPVIAPFQKVYSPLLNMYIGITEWRDNVTEGYESIVEWRIKGTAGGKEFDRVVSAPEPVVAPYVDVQRLGIKVASMDTVPAFSGETMDVTLYTVDKNGNRRKSNMTTLKVPTFPTVTQPVMDQMNVMTDDSGWTVNITLKSDVSSYASMLLKYAVTAGGKTTTYSKTLTGAEYNTKKIVLNKKTLDPMPLGDWDLTLIGLSKDNYSADMTHQKFTLN